MRISAAERRKYLDEATAFSAMGKYINDVSRLEYSIDEFVWSIAECRSVVVKALGKRYPTRVEQKLDFYQSVMVRSADLWSEPLYDDGSLPVTGLCLGVKEAFEIRNFLAHGAIDLTQEGDGWVKYTASKIRLETLPHKSTDRYTIGAGFLIGLASNVHAYRNYFDRLTRKVKGAGDFETHYKQQCRLHDNRNALSHLFDMPINNIFQAALKNETLEVVNPL